MALIRRVEPIVSFGTAYKNHIALRTLSSAKQSLNYCDKPVASRTTVSPAFHSLEHVGLWYTVDTDAAGRLFGLGCLPKLYVELNDVLNETALMVRKPAVQVIKWIKESNLSLPPNKFIFYGLDGAGKSMSLAHVTHFLDQDGWVLLHVPWIVNWSRRFKEIVPSLKVEGRYDHTVDSAVWLQHFKTVNLKSLQDPNLVTHDTYEWTKREATEKGAPLLAVVDKGIDRARLGSECVIALTSELKQHATEGRIKLAIIIDGVNALFDSETRYRREDRTFVHPLQLTLFQAFHHFFSFDWRNGCIVCTVDGMANYKERRVSYLPRYLLGLKGWETMDPFVPVPVEYYSPMEFNSAVSYYIEKKWIQNPLASTEEARLELNLMTGRSPRILVQQCAGL